MEIRYQKIYDLEGNVKLAELLANFKILKEFNKKYRSYMEKVDFDLYNFKNILKNKDKIKNLKNNYGIPQFSFNVYPSTIDFFYRFNNSNLFGKYLYLFEKIGIKVVEILESDEINGDEKNLLSFIKSLDFNTDIAIDDISYKVVGKRNNHTIDKILDYESNELIKYLKFDNTFLKYLKNSIFIRNKFEKILNKINNFDKILIFEGIETLEDLEFVKSIKNKYPFLVIFVQGYYLHRPEIIK